jgi:hypothetical protein
VTTMVVGFVSVGSAGTASAETYAGTFEGGRHVSLTTNEKDEVREIVFHRWRASCSGGVHLTEGTRFSPVTRLSPRKFVTKGRYVVHQRDGDYDITIRDGARGTRVSRSRWSGTFRASGVVRKDGKTIDRCTLAPTHWRASLRGRTPGDQGDAPASLEMHSDEGDYIGQGLDYSYATPGDAVYVSGDRHLISASAGPWSLNFSAPPGRRLGDGSYGHARRYPFNDDHPGLDVSGDGRGCNEETGFFVIRRSRFDHDGDLRAVELSFEQHCEGGDPALRGTLRLRVAEQGPSTRPSSKAGLLYRP